MVHAGSHPLSGDVVAAGALQIAQVILGGLEFSCHALESTALICVLETNYCR
jgi:hypothetical protein